MKIYEDELGYAEMAETPTTVGHIKVFPKRKVENFNELTDEEAAHLFYIASFAATGVFEGLGAQGTNIVMQSGKITGNEHDNLCINVLPRSFEDGIDFKWKPKKLSPEQLKEVMDKIKDETFYIGKSHSKNPNPLKFPDEPPMEKLKNMNDSYLTKQLDRLP